MSGPTGTPRPPPYRVAAIQFEPTLFAKAANLEALLRLTEEAAAGGAKLIVTPEMATTAYCWATREEVAGDVEPIPGPTTDRFAEIAARYDCWIVVGLPEVVAGDGRLLQQRRADRPRGTGRALPQDPRLHLRAEVGQGRRPRTAGLRDAARPHRHDDLHGRLLPRDGAHPGAGRART